VSYRIPILFCLLLLIGCSNDDELLKVKRDLTRAQEQIYQIERAQNELREELRTKSAEIDRKLEDRKEQADLYEDLRAMRERLEQAEALIYDLESSMVEMRRAETEVTLSPTGEGTDTAGEQGGDTLDTNAGPPVTDRPDTPGSGDVTVSGNLVEQQFNQALLDYNRGKYDVAIIGFSDVLTNFPGSPYTEPSHYYLGVSHFQKKAYQKARDSFAQISARYPDGDFIKQSKLYEGQCYYYLNQHSRAILTLRDLIDNYPGTQEAALARQFLEKTGYER